MKLHTTLRSPYARKIRVMAIEKGLDKQIQIVIEDLKNKSDELLKANPLGAVPTLILENGKGLYDSPVIAEYIDSLSKEPRLIPKRGNKRFYVLKISALADAMIECAVGMYYENLKKNNGEIFDEAKYKKFSDALTKAFKAVNKEAKRLAKEVNMASIAIASAIGYINFRLPDINWQKKNEKLANWFADFSNRPSMKTTMPKE